MKVVWQIYFGLDWSVITCTLRETQIFLYSIFQKQPVLQKIAM